jgi:RimJ/RimL family protein N-acetyltransferase
MDKAHFLNKNGIFAEDEDFLLRKPIETDKDAYLSLFAEIVNEPTIYEDENLRSIPWQTALKNGLELFIINKENNELCGDITLKNYASKTPEIGIDLFQKYQNQGIGYRMVKLLIETTCNIHKVDFFIVRIYSDNFRSQKLFKNLVLFRLIRKIVSSQCS